MRRPTAVRPCPDCHDLLGRGYPDCDGCSGALEALWLADWHLLCERRSVPTVAGAQRDLAEQVLTAPVGSFPWTCVDLAMSLLGCTDCRAELATGGLDCVPCGIAEAQRWAWDHQAPPGAISANEHALRQARATLRAPHRYRATVVLSWQLALPFLLAGAVTETHHARWIRAYLRAGRYEELAAAGSYAQLAALPELPWR